MQRSIITTEKNLKGSIIAAGQTKKRREATGVDKNACGCSKEG